MRTLSIFAFCPDYRKKPKSDYYCVVCQKAIRKGSTHRLIHLVDGGNTVLHPQDEHLYQPDGGDCGLHPIGNDCAKKAGLEWSIKQTTHEH